MVYEVLGLLLVPAIIMLEALFRCLPGAPRIPRANTRRARTIPRAGRLAGG